jgi:hypothetical protein
MTKKKEHLDLEFEQVKKEKICTNLEFFPSICSDRFLLIVKLMMMSLNQRQCL